MRDNRALVWLNEPIRDTGSRCFGLRASRTDAQDFKQWRDVALAFELYFSHRAQLKTLADFFLRRLGDQERRAEILVGGFHASAGVHAVADDGVVGMIGGTDVADDDLGGMDANADVDRVLSGQGARR